MTEERPEPRRLTVTDPQVMRALAHPARLAILEHLAATGVTATATECAEVVGLSPSATSYHLRSLAGVGLVEAAPSRGDARERVWRAVGESVWIEGGQAAGPETRAAELALLDAHAARAVERARRWLRRAPEEAPEWYRAARFADSRLLLTAEELVALNEAVDRLLDPYRHRNRAADRPSGARAVSVNYQAVPID